MITNLPFRLCRKYNVKRIFMDECHEPLTGRNFRPQWAGIQRLIVDNSWQMIHLTATLPIHLQEAWETLLGINKNRTIFIRGHTNQLELAYHVFHVNPKEHHMDSVAKNLISMLEDEDVEAE